MMDRRLQELMDRPAPGEGNAERRSHQIVRAAFAEREPERPHPARARVLIAAAAALAVAVAMTLTPAGGAVADWIREGLGEPTPGERPAERALTSLPAGGELLVSSGDGPWIVHSDGSQRLLGSYDEASWSPGGLFVIATRGRQLVALTPLGEPRWSLARPARVDSARWAPSGVRVAYLSGETLRTVEGDGSHDELVARGVARVPPAWRPDRPNSLAFADAQGRVTVVDVATGRTHWRSPRRERLAQLEWSSDGERLVAVSRRNVRVYDGNGRKVEVASLPRGIPGAAVAGARIAAFAPSGRAFALLRASRAPGLSEVVLMRPGARAGQARLLFKGGGNFSELAWSPNGRRLVVGWPSADQWLFLQPDRPAQLTAVSNVTRQFSPGAEHPRAEGLRAFPEISGWCCPP